MANTVKLVVASDKLTYDKRRMVRGDQFEASEKHAKILKLAKKANDAPPGPAKYTALDLQPAPGAPPETETPNGKPRTYRRRDMKAER